MEFFWEEQILFGRVRWSDEIRKAAGISWMRKELNGKK